VQPTIEVVKTSPASQIVPGRPVAYVITVTNTGMVMARNVTATDRLPAG
jgi:uncharacterized repeat protein (TIGR01451 family)